MNSGNTFLIFSENDLSMFLNAHLCNMKDDIHNRTEDYILNVNENEFMLFLIGKYSIENLDFRFDEKSVSYYEKQIPAEMFPGGGFTFNVAPGKSYNKVVIRYHIPFTGEVKILRCKPNSWITSTVEVAILDNCVCFDIINFYNDNEKIQHEAKESISRISTQLKEVENQVKEYNSSLESKATEFFQNRKQDLLKRNDLISSLGVPIKRRENISLTFAIPTPNTLKKINISPPKVKEKGFKPEPTLDSTIYQDILQIIQDVGKQFERMPSTYYEKEEESLRDHILLVLEPHFSGSATGETFNKKGKTDILLRYESSNVFIAECKFWRGEKAYLETIDQLLGYLTWRDSKSAILLFVRNKDFSSVIQTVEAKTSTHSNYLGFSNMKDETWFNYRFHINDDPNREVKLAVLLFHIPLL